MKEELRREREKSDSGIEGMHFLSKCDLVGKPANVCGMLSLIPTHFQHCEHSMRQAGGPGIADCMSNIMNNRTWAHPLYDSNEDCVMAMLYWFAHGCMLPGIYHEYAVAELAKKSHGANIQAGSEERK